MPDVIAFVDQQSWEDIGTAMYEEYKLSVTTTASQAMHIPVVAPNGDVKHALTYKDTNIWSEKVVLDLLIEEAEVPNGVEPYFDATGLEVAVRQVVAHYQAVAKDLDCHTVGRYLTEDNKIQGALVRVFRNADFECKGHPEMLFGSPIGMFHCDKCGEMQVAGSFHLAKEETANG
ncbi:hypothetical protein HOS33_gp238 [Erwinia phage vB_EamM_Y3]|uniref:Uncharacterized protein n=1 Tax=Erwinia phage vB_EamM_Y3 TaxID=1983553 RepID=A0A2H4IBE4_9CAUD|nr:hypothetical protein HOS33_gp238 [Erwinia phage vB_EamM_Y3]ARW58878.1 hypothetical protein Y3_238 [Erwinia phage vB_EamM_Y3]